MKPKNSQKCLKSAKILILPVGLHPMLLGGRPKVTASMRSAPIHRQTGRPSACRTRAWSAGSLSAGWPQRRAGQL